MLLNETDDATGEQGAVRAATQLVPPGRHTRPRGDQGEQGVQR